MNTTIQDNKESEMEWQPINKCSLARSSDEDADLVLLANEDGDVSVGVVYLRKDGTKRGVAGMFSSVVWTHWMPLPSPPYNPTTPIIGKGNRK